MLRILVRHRVGDRVEVQSLSPRQTSQPGRGAYDGVDEQDHQHRMQQPHPGMEAEDLIRQSNGLADPSLPDPPGIS